MRVVVATDGCAGATLACRVAAAMPWPRGSVIRVVTVVPPDTANGCLAGGWESRVLADAHLVADREDVQWDLRHGDPVSEVVKAAFEFEADLIIVGSRGWGPWATGLPGSVSAGIVDHAGCAVLVVRGAHLEPILLATDGSEHALQAESVMRRWPRSSGDPVRVVSVRHPPARAARLASAMVVGATRAEVDAPLDAVACAQASAARLAAIGVPAETVALDGDPADAIVRAAREAGAGLIVLGTRGRTGIKRLLLGSVARKVLTHASCSVLVVRPAGRGVTLAEMAPAAIAAG